MSISPLFFLLLLITIDDRHADQEESNYGVGEDILRGRKKTMLREAWTARDDHIFYTNRHVFTRPIYRVRRFYPYFDKMFSRFG